MFHHQNIDDAPYIVLAYYHFVQFADPHAEVHLLKEYLRELDVTCRVYISEEGVNAQMSFKREDAYRYMEWLKGREGFQDVHFKCQGAERQVFPRVTVKRKPLVAFQDGISLSRRAPHLSPADWKKMLQEEKDALIIDVRNSYEWGVGHFKGAESVPYDTFREFSIYAQELKKKLDDKPKKVMMYCTGGIRCEYFSALLLKEGIEDVYQLDGGVIHYGEKEGADLWDGSLFVFDDRLTVPVGEGSEEVIGRCHSCGVKVDNFYNCANTDCNALFLSCSDCLEKLVGCCKEACSEAPRVRPFQYAHTPFRRWYNYAPSKEIHNISTVGEVQKT